jgi:probable HAF family extracellular repeat protein
MRRTLAALVGVVLMACLPAAAADAPRYSVTRIPADPFTGIGGFDLNDAGQVVGWRGNYDDPRRPWNGFVWTRSGGMIDLGVGPAAFAINEAGQVVGRDQDAALDFHAFTWTPTGGVRRLSDLPGGAAFSGALFSDAVRINNVGQIVGHIDTGGGSRAYVRNPDGAIRYLPVPQGLPAQDVIAFGMNDAGDVVGRVKTADSTYHAFVWPAAGGYRDLGDLPGGLTLGTATHITNAGQILGDALTDPNPTDPHSNGQRAVVFLEDGTIRQIGLLPGMSDSSVRDVNDLGEIVGSSGSGSWYDWRAFVWSESGGMRNLNDLLDASGAGWTLSLPQAINNLGQIVVVGQFDGKEATALLTPVPEVTAAAVAATFTPFALLARRRRT